MAAKNEAEDRYVAAKAAWEKARKAQENAEKRNESLRREYCEALHERNHVLPAGFYFEGEFEGEFALSSEALIYFKHAEAGWLVNDGQGFVRPSWLDEEGEFDIDVTPISEVKF